MVSNFLSLAPETSSSYPTRRASTSTADAAATATADAGSAADAGTTAAVATDAAAKEATSAVDLTAAATASGTTMEAKPRRSSSISSSGSAGLKFLRLGPVHFGGDPREADFVLLSEE